MNDAVWPIFDLFTLCGSQWLVGPTGHRTSLRYEAVFATASAVGIEVDRDFVEYIKAIEMGVLAATYDRNLTEVLGDG